MTSTIPEESPSVIEATPTTVAQGSPDKMQPESPILNPDGSVYRPELSAPLPILPKVTTVFTMPVKCPMENVRFVNLKRFLQF